MAGTGAECAWSGRFSSVSQQCGFLFDRACDGCCQLPRLRRRQCVQRQAKTIEVVFDEVRAIFENWEKRSDGFHYARKQEFWHTEGNFDFIGALSEERRAAWRIQFFTRAFASGIRKVCVMDASKLEIAAVRTYVEALPWPFPMERADNEIKTLTGDAKVVAYRHKDESGPEGGQVWILWVAAGDPNATVEIPVSGKVVTVAQTDGTKTQHEAKDGRITAELVGDKKMAPPIIAVDRRASAP